MYSEKCEMCCKMYLAEYSNDALLYSVKYNNRKVVKSVKIAHALNSLRFTLRTLRLGCK